MQEYYTTFDGENACVCSALSCLSISAFLFVLTMEGIEVWTFPSDKLPVVGGPAGSDLKDGGLGGGGGVWTPLSSSSGTSPRPCLLHVQQLEVSDRRLTCTVCPFTLGAGCGHMSHVQGSGAVCSYE